MIFEILQCTLNDIHFKLKFYCHSEYIEESLYYYEKLNDRVVVLY